MLATELLYTAKNAVQQKLKDTVATQWLREQRKQRTIPLGIGRWIMAQADPGSTHQHTSNFHDFEAHRASPIHSYSCRFVWPHLEKNHARHQGMEGSKLQLYEYVVVLVVMVVMVVFTFQLTFRLPLTSPMVSVFRVCQWRLCTNVLGDALESSVIRFGFLMDPMHSPCTRHSMPISTPVAGPSRCDLVDFAEPGLSNAPI